MNPRLAVLLFVTAGVCSAQPSLSPTAELKAELKESYRFLPEPVAEPVAPTPALEDDSVVQFEPFTVTAFNEFENDVGNAARRAAEAREAAKFSPLKGGLIGAKQLGQINLKLGVWPNLVPYTDDITRTKGMKLSVDVFRIDW